MHLPDVNLARVVRLHFLQLVYLFPVIIKIAREVLTYAFKGKIKTFCSTWLFLCLNGAFKSQVNFLKNSLCVSIYFLNFLSVLVVRYDCVSFQFLINLMQQMIVYFQI